MLPLPRFEPLAERGVPSRSSQWLRWTRSPSSLVAGAALLVPGCATTLESADVARTPTSSLAPALDSPLGRLFAVGSDDAGVGESLFAPLDRGDEALDLRLALAGAAVSSIDVQSYLWHEDGAGSLLLDSLFDAADRGVRVRILMDGFKLEGHEALDEQLALHPRVEFRSFNPTLHRAGVWRKVEQLENLGRLDHRMHDKLMLVDGVACVFGGRNVGDEYFGLGDEFNLRDFDLVGAGQVASELAGSFDEFWNSEWALPIGAQLGGRRGEPDSGQAREALQDLHRSDRRLDARRAWQRAEQYEALVRVREQMLPGRAVVMGDTSEIRDGRGTGAMARGFEAAFAAADGDVLIVTAYLVPDEVMLGLVQSHTQAGHRVRILTNSYVSTNQPLVHAYYSSTRGDLLVAGAELYELRGDAFSGVHHRSAGGSAPKLGLHAKAAVFGDDHVLVASMNVDPRSMELNVELGVLIESRDLTAWVERCLERELAARNAWRVEMDADGELTWSSLDVVLDNEPGMDAGDAAWMSFLRMLPLDGEV